MSAGLLSLLLLAATPQPWEGFVPAGVQAGFVWRMDAAVASQAVSFDVSPEGQPVLASGAVVFPLSDREGRELPPFKLAGAERLDELGFTRDGALLGISGTTLGAATSKGFQLVARLPGPGFHLAMGSLQETWLWGGESVYRLARGGKVEHFARAPAAIEALAADGARVVLATQGALFEVSAGREPKVLTTLPLPVRSLALAPDGSIFYSTEREVGLISPAGVRVPFVKGKGARLRVSAGALFLFFEGEGLVRCTPVERFTAMAAAIEAIRKDGGP